MVGRKKKQGFYNPLDCNIKMIYIGEEEALENKFKKRCEKCHPDMYPYEELSEKIKEYDRVTVRTVLNATNEID